jgi:hypothetical protein
LEFSELAYFGTKEETSTIHLTLNENDLNG